MSNVLKKIRELIKNKKFLDSLTLIDDIPNYTKNFELISLKGFVYLNLKEFKKSYDCYSEAIKINNYSFECFNLRATTSFELGNFIDSIKDLKKSLLIDDRLHETYENIGKCYSNLGNNIEAVKYYELALERSPKNNRLIELISEKLSIIDVALNKKTPLNELSLELKKLRYEYSSNKKIDDNDIIKILKNAEYIINENFSNLFFNQTQIFRKNKTNLNLNCDRHFLVFRNFKIIPKFCFSCIKVSINLNNVMELIKLFFIFDNLSLANNNLRKCMIDLRKNSKSNYKGFIYCRSINEAKIIKDKLDKLLKINISAKLSANIKRGCSAFNEKYPGYENTLTTTIDYNVEWKKYETIVDEKFPKYKYMHKNYDTKKGINLYDIMIIKNWLFFAKLTNDQTYKKLTHKIIDNENLKRIIEHNKLGFDV